MIELFKRFEEARYLLNNVECWSARELQDIFGYADWRNFAKIIDKAKNACEKADGAIADHFVDVNKMVEVGKSLPPTG